MFLRTDSRVGGDHCALILVPAISLFYFCAIKIPRIRNFPYTVHQLGLGFVSTPCACGVNFPPRQSEGFFPLVAPYLHAFGFSTLCGTVHHLIQTPYIFTKYAWCLFFGFVYRQSLFPFFPGICIAYSSCNGPGKQSRAHS